MKKALITFVQFVLFLFVFAVGSFLPLLHLPSIVTKSPDGTHSFQWDGILLMLALFALILLIELANKRIRTAGRWTTLAFVLATSVGLIMKLGFMTVQR